MKMRMDRRTALALLGAGVMSSSLEAAQHHLHILKTQPKEYKLQFFSPEEHLLIDSVAELILPADDHSPGAHQAAVASYIDLVIANSSEQLQSDWKSRLNAFDQFATAEQGKPFMLLDSGKRGALLNRVAQREKAPTTPAEHFFVDMKKLTLFAYYRSEIGLLKELGYKGNAVLDGFPGCPHEPSVHQ